MLDAGEDMFVVRVRGGQLRVVGMLKGVIPEDSLASPLDLVTVIENPPGVKVKEFPYIRHYVALKGHLSLQFGQNETDGCQHQCGILDDRVRLW